MSERENLGKSDQRLENVADPLKENRIPNNDGNRKLADQEVVTWSQGHSRIAVRIAVTFARALDSNGGLREGSESG